MQVFVNFVVKAMAALEMVISNLHKYRIKVTHEQFPNSMKVVSHFKLVITD